MKQLWLLFLKDLKVEVNRKELLATGTGLGLLLAVVSYFGLQSAFLKPSLEQALFPAFFWLAFIFSATAAFSRTFDQDLKHEAIEGLVLQGVSFEKIYLSKVISSLCLVVPLFVIIFLALFLLLNLDISLIGPALLASSGLVVFGFISLAVLFSALTGRLDNSSLLFPMVFLPLLFPLFFAGVELYAALLVDRSFSWSSPWVSLLMAADTVYFLLGLNLFRFAIRR